MPLRQTDRATIFPGSALFQRTAAGEPERCDQIEPADPRRLLRLGKVIIHADLADKARVAVPFAHLSRKVDKWTNTGHPLSPPIEWTSTRVTTSGPVSRSTGSSGIAAIHPSLTMGRFRVSPQL